MLINVIFIYNIYIIYKYIYFFYIDYMPPVHLSKLSSM